MQMLFRRSPTDEKYSFFTVKKFKEQKSSEKWRNWPLFQPWPKQLTAKMKERRKRAARELLARHGRGGNRFTGMLITAEETWVRHYEPETERADGVPAARVPKAKEIQKQSFKGRVPPF